MENTINYGFTAVPTKFMLLLDNKLQSILFNLIQLSNAYAGEDGYFYRSNTNLQKDFGFGKNVTIAAIETFYRLGVISVRSNGFKKGVRSTVNYFKINTEKFEDYEKFSIPYILNIKEVEGITILDYKAEDYKVTYTASTESTENVISDVLTTVEVSSSVVAHNEAENAPEAKGTALNEELPTVVESEVADIDIEERKINTTPTVDRDIADRIKTLIDRLKTAETYGDFYRKLDLYIEWINDKVKDQEAREYYINVGEHVIDELFEPKKAEETPKVEPKKAEIEDKDIEIVSPFSDTDKVLELETVDIRKLPTKKGAKVYRYEETKEMVTLAEAKEKGFKLYLLFDVENSQFFNPFAS